MCVIIFIIENAILTKMIHYSKSTVIPKQELSASFMRNFDSPILVVTKQSDTSLDRNDQYGDEQTAIC